MTARASLTAQAAAVEAAARYIGGGPKPRQSEAMVIVKQLLDGAQTIRDIEREREAARAGDNRGRDT